MSKKPPKPKKDPADKLTEDEYNEIANQNVMLGKLMMLEQLEHEFRADAGRSYAYGHEETAKWERGWADTLKKRHDELRVEFDTKYHPELLKK